MDTVNEVTLSIGEQIKNALVAASRDDGLKRTQRWLANRINMGEVEMSNKIANTNDKTFTKEDLEKINAVLGTSL